MSKLNSILSRPLSPHLTIYSSQFTSTFSIWHRITGVTLVLVLLISLFSLKIISSKFCTPFFEIGVNLWIQKLILINLVLFFNYHSLNGLRHIIWDLSFVLSSSTIGISVKFIILVLSSISLFIIFKIVI